jgi:DNA-binding CsgD family transcriptional regulator
VVPEPLYDQTAELHALTVIDHPLSSRELEVLEMTSRGLTNAQIAESLCVTVHAVKFHLGSVYRKLGVANRTEASVWLLRHQSAAS